MKTKKLFLVSLLFTFIIIISCNPADSKKNDFQSRGQILRNNLRHTQLEELDSIPLLRGEKLLDVFVKDSQIWVIIEDSSNFVHFFKVKGKKLVINYKLFLQ